MIKNDLDKLRVYVHNRIKQVVPSTFKFKYVSSKNNPGDFLTKDHNPNSYLTNNMWLHGPPFLRTMENDPYQPTIAQDALDPSTIEDIKSEIKDLDGILINNLLISTKNPDIWGILSKTNNLGKALRITAYIFRFIRAIYKPIAKNRIANTNLKSSDDMNEPSLIADPCPITNEICKVLGLNYDPLEDLISFEPCANLVTDNIIYTKHYVSSVIPKTFSPFGPCSSACFKGKEVA